MRQQALSRLVRILNAFRAAVRTVAVLRAEPPVTRGGVAPNARLGDPDGCVEPPRERAAEGDS